MPTDFSAVTPAGTALVCTPVQVANGDTINGNDIANGAVFIVNNGGVGSINVTFTDPGHTPAGTAAATPTATAVAAGVSKAFGKTQLTGYIDPATNKVTVTYSGTTTVTAGVVA